MRISAPGSRVALYVMPTDEELMIARHTLALLAHRRGLAALDMRRGRHDPVAPKRRCSKASEGLIVGIANEHSIAWGCAKAFRALGAELAVTYLNDKAKKFVEPLARELEAPIFMPLDVRTPGQMEAVFERISKEWGELDFLVHSIAFSPKETLRRPRRRRAARRLSHDHGCVVLVIHPHGASGRAADDATAARCSR